MTVATKKPAAGKLSLRRRKELAAAKKEAEQAEPSLIQQAMDALPGYTYPTAGKQLILHAPGLKLMREANVGFVPAWMHTLMKEG